jgi:hypothetical protein
MTSGALVPFEKRVVLHLYTCRGSAHRSVSARLVTATLCRAYAGAPTAALGDGGGLFQFISTDGTGPLVDCNLFATNVTASNNVAGEAQGVRHVERVESLWTCCTLVPCPPRSQPLATCHSWCILALSGRNGGGFLSRFGHSTTEEAQLTISATGDMTNCHLHATDITVINNTAGASQPQR